MFSKTRAGLLCVLGALSACAVIPSGPSMLVLPGSAKSFDQFRADDLSCRQYAGGQTGGTSAAQAASDSAVRSAAVGTAVGAAAGAAIGGSGGVGPGAGTGLLFGAVAGSGMGAGSGYAVQQRYDYAYVQCMYAAGHQVPLYGRPVAATRLPPAPGTLPPGVPPPPAGRPPPPPPGVAASGGDTPAAPPGTTAR